MTVYLNGKSVRFSDVDIAIDNHGEPITDLIKFKLAALFERSILPYSVDITDINSVSQAFKSK